MKKKNILLLGWGLLFMLFSCRGGGDDNTPVPSTSPAGPPEIAVHLSLPSPLAYLSNRNGASDIFMMQTDETELQLTSGMEVNCFSWAPDGTNIVFASDTDGNIHRVDLANPLTYTRLTTSGLDDCPEYSHAGGKIAFTRYSSLVSFDGGPLFNETVEAVLTSPKSTPISVLGDFNGDGNNDLAITNEDAQGDGRLSVYLNIDVGNLTLGSPDYLYSIPSYKPIYMVGGDVNNDPNGNMDLIVLSVDSALTSGIISVYTGNSDGSFTKLGTDIPLTGAIAFIEDQIDTGYGNNYVRNRKYLKLADLDNDGKIDLLVQLEGEKKVQIYTGNGDGTFTFSFDVVSPGPPSPINPNCTSVIAQLGDVGGFVLGEFNGDGYIDMAMMYYDCYYKSPSWKKGYYMIAVFTGAMNQNVFQFQTPAAGITAIPELVSTDPFRSWDSGDFDNDGIDEIAISFYGMYRYFARLQIQTGMVFSLSEYIDWSVIAQNVWGLPPNKALFYRFLLYEVQAADINADGKTDVLIYGQSNGGDYSAIVYGLDNGQGTFDFLRVPENTKTYYMKYQSLAFADLDNDALPDIIAGTYYFDGQPSVMEERAEVFLNANQTQSEIFVMNADGSNQTKLTNIGLNSWGVTWSPDDTRLSFVTNRIVTSPTIISVSEIYLINPDGTEYQKWINFSFSKVISPIWSPDNLYISYMDGVQLVKNGNVQNGEMYSWQVRINSTDYMWLYEGDGQGAFGNAVKDPFRNRPDLFGIEAGDFNNDGFPDIIAASEAVPYSARYIPATYKGQFGIFVTDGLGGSIYKSIDLPLALSNFSQKVSNIVIDDFGSDVNGSLDGNLDLIISIRVEGASNLTKSPIFILYGDGTGGFSSAVQLSDRWEYMSAPVNSQIAAADFDQDGRTDIVFIDNTFNNERLVVLINNGIGTWQSSSYSLPSAGYSLTAGDFDEDTYPDIAGKLFNDITFLFNTGVANPGIFTPGTNITGFKGYLVSGDFDGDTHIDLAVADDVNNNALYLFYGDGLGNFPVQSQFVLDVWTAPAVTADFNNDAIDDIAVLGSGGNVLLMEGAAARTFTQVAGPGFRSGWQGIWAGEASGDTNDDIIVFGSSAINFELTNTVNPFYPTSDGWCCANPSFDAVWSPDNTQLVFSSLTSIYNTEYNDYWAYEKLYLVNISTWTDSSLTAAGDWNDWSPSWSFDSSKLAFVSDRDGDPEIYIINPDSTGEANLSLSPLSAEWSPIWSPVP